jgi:Holliday junction resolvase RusA-like endonuclease
MWEYSTVFEGGVLIDPRGKGRPRFSKSGHAFTDSKTRQYEAALRAVIKKAYEGPLIPKTIPVGIDAVFNVPQIKKPVRDMPTVKPDADNLVKSLLDALNGILIEDDSQVCELNVKKRYAAEGYIQFRVYLLNAVTKVG